MEDTTSKTNKKKILFSKQCTISPWDLLPQKTTKTKSLVGFRKGWAFLWLLRTYSAQITRIKTNKLNNKNRSPDCFGRDMNSSALRQTLATEDKKKMFVGRCEGIYKPHIGPNGVKRQYWSQVALSLQIC